MRQLAATARTRARRFSDMQRNGTHADKAEVAKSVVKRREALGTISISASISAKQTGTICWMLDNGQSQRRLRTTLIVVLMWI